MKKQRTLARIVLFAFIMSMPVLVAAAPKANNNNASEEHRNQMADIVQQLKSVAEQDKGIGQEIQQIAEEQSSSTEETSSIMKRVENRSRFATFFLGTDYKNLGKLRSQLVTSDNSINRLQKALARSTSSSTQAELSTQITAFESVNSSTRAFIQNNEDKFSLFGWLLKLFQ